MTVNIVCVSQTMFYIIEYWQSKDTLVPSSWFQMKSLEKRRGISDMMFLYKILNNQIKRSSILSLISFNVPRRLPRCRIKPLCQLFRRTALGANSPVARFNLAVATIDLRSVKTKNLKILSTIFLCFCLVLNNYTICFRVKWLTWLLQ